MNFGGLIAGALGGGSRAVEEMATNEIKQREVEVGERRRFALNREEAAAAAADKLAGEDARMKRYAESSDKVDKRASEIGMQRDVSTANRVAPSVDDGTMSIIKERLSPADQERFYGVKQTPASGMVQDKINAAREIGADPALRKDLGDEYKQVSKAESDAAKAARDERKMDETERKNLRSEELRSQQMSNVLAAAEIRASKSSSSAAKSEAMLNLNTTVSTQQKIIKDTEERMRLLSKSSPEYASAAEEVRQAREISDMASKAIKGKLGGGEAPDAQPKPPAAKPAINALPAGAKKIGTSGGKDVYQTPDGKKFISQ